MIVLLLLSSFINCESIRDHYEPVFESKPIHFSAFHEQELRLQGFNNHCLDRFIAYGLKKGYTTETIVAKSQQLTLKHNLRESLPQFKNQTLIKFLLIEYQLDPRLFGEDLKLYFTPCFNFQLRFVSATPKMKEFLEKIKKETDGEFVNKEKQFLFN